MSITFHCDHCNNKITAKDESAGKWGICPACHNKVYVPNLNVDIDDLKLAPIDEEEEAKRKELMAETYRLQQDILQQKEDEQAAAGRPSKPVKPSAFPIDPKVLEKRVITYLRKMGSGSLEEAQSMEDEITPYGQQAIKILDKIALSEIPEPELAKIPPAVISTIVRNLRSKIVT